MLALMGSGSDIKKVKKLVNHALLSTPTERVNKENKPPRKNFKLGLPDTEVNKINGDKKLTDFFMNLAHQLISCYQWPSVNTPQK